MVAHLAVSLIEEKLFLRKFELKKLSQEVAVSNDDTDTLES